MRGFVWMSLLVAACDVAPADLGPGEDPPVDSVPGPAVTYQQHVRPLFDAQCLACHHEDGIAPFSMTYDAEAWADGPPEWVEAAVASVEAGRMPPWKPAEGCAPMENERRLTPAQREQLTTWAALGYPEGDSAMYVPPQSLTAASDRPADTKLKMPEAFTPDRTEPDDYRCFPLAFDSSEEVWLQALEVLPDQQKMVHHVILYQLGPEYAQSVADWDAAEEGPGYSCLFDPGTYDSLFVGAWAPGQPPVRFPEGTARRLPEGSVLVLQVHYNTQPYADQVDIPADQTGVNLWYLPVDEPPEQELVAIPFPVYPDIPAGDPNAIAEQSISLSDLLGYVPESLIELFAPMVRNVGVYPHMHQLGTRITVDITRSDESNMCLFDIPDWDFAWQQGYFFKPEAWYTPDVGDTIRLRCEYDNSPENQPVINGVQQEPRDVRWGEGTGDEMCLVFFETLLPVGLFSGF